MRVVVLGAGTVGRNIAAMLAQERHEVSVVDRNPDLIRQIEGELDVRGLVGEAAQSSVLFQAGVSDADICLAVTGSDEANLVGASLAKAMGSRRAIARVFAPIYRDYSTFDYRRHFHIDRLLSLEHLAALELARAIRGSELFPMESLVQSEVEIQEVPIADEVPAVGKPLKDLRLPPGVRVGAICRNGKWFIAGAEDRILVADRVVLVGTREEIAKVHDLFGIEHPELHVVIAGGGETGYHLAQLLDNRYFSVTLLESRRERCDFLAAHLERVTVLHADAQQRTVLEEEHVGDADVFVACTGDDEDNIIACVEALDLGVKRAMAIVARPDYANVVRKLGIEVAISPRVVMARQVRSFLTRGPVVSRIPLAERSGIHVVEIEVPEQAPATQAQLADLRLPAQVLVAALIREGYTWTPGAKDRIMPGDTVVLFMNDSAFEEVLELFSADSGL
jgi:trk system potassium uptake protein TrkA